MRIRPLIETFRGGDLRARMTAIRSGRAAIRVAAIGAGLRTGILDSLRDRPMSVAELATTNGWYDEAVLEAVLRVLAELGLLREIRGRWEVTKHGRRVLEDDVVRASYEGFSGYHTGLYTEIEQQLTGAGSRRDILEQGELIARLSRVFDPFVFAELERVVQDLEPTSMLDVGCGSATNLVHMLQAAPGALGVGVETDPDAATLARETVRTAGLEDRAEVVRGDVREVLADRPPTESFDLVLVANVVYYLPMAERVPLFRSIAERLTPGGRVVVISTALTDDTFSRHFDLLLRAQHGAMELPDISVLGDQLREAGLVPLETRRIASGEPLTSVVAGASAPD